MRSVRLAALALLPLVACDGAEQPHPLEVVGTDVTREISSDGGFISTPAGAAVYVAPGAGGPVTFTLEAAPLPGQLAASGRLVGPSGFRLGPAGRSLPDGSRAELKISAAPEDSLWLTSVVRYGHEGVVEHGNTRVDLSLMIATSRIVATGTLAAVVPVRDAVVGLTSEIPAPPPARQLTPAEVLMLMSIDSLTVNCGAPAARCSGVVVAATDNLLGRVSRAALVYPRLQGVLRRDGYDVVGSVSIDAAFRVELGSRVTAENVPLSTTFPVRASLVEAALTQGALEPLLAAGSEADERITVYPPRDDEPARAVIERTVQVPNAAGLLEPARIYISFPFQVHTR
jgi:hypothetical protein